MLVWVNGENPELSMATLRRVGSKVLYLEKVSYTVYVTYRDHLIYKGRTPQ